jgi:hypothetical protein
VAAGGVDEDGDAAVGGVERRGADRAAEVGGPAGGGGVPAVEAKNR